MSRSWHDTENDAENAQQRQEFWLQLRQNVRNGAFWADQIKQLHGDPPARLEKAMANLPLPAAFREAAVALRAIIRTKRKSGGDWAQELGVLYQLAAIRSFCLDYSEPLQQPGFNVIETIPAKKLFDLPFDYDKLGYQHLNLLTKTDVKWLRERFGEPSDHTTLNALHPELWREYEDKTAARQEKEAVALREQFDVSPSATGRNSNDGGQPSLSPGQRRKPQMTQQRAKLWLLAMGGLALTLIAASS